MILSLIDFIITYPDELSCKQKFKEYRDEVGVICSKCGGESHYWKRDKEQYEYKACKTRTTLRSGTIIHKSKLPYAMGYTIINYLIKKLKRKTMNRNGELGFCQLFTAAMDGLIDRYKFLRLYKYLFGEF